MSASNQKEIADTIESVAMSHYGDPNRRKIRPPLDQLVESLLWRQTSIRRGTRALRQLKREFVDWNEVRVSHREEVANAMANTEWAMDSARRIQRILGKLFTLRHEMSLECLHDLTKAEGRAFLQSLPEVSSDLVDEVLLFTTGVKLFPVNDDIARMAYRLGLVPNPRVTKRNQKRLMDHWEPEVHVAIVQFFLDNASAICSEEDPAHDECPLNELCPREGMSE
ncbi:MAG: hypothetical protein ACOC0A_00795 [Planctomycetota bacterium]